MSYQILHGDCLAVLATLPTSSVDAIVTDPPYGLSFMGKRWDYDVPSVEIWRECFRVLKPGGHLLSFAGTRTQHRMAVNIEDAGFEIRDMIAWVYGSGFPKSHNLKEEWQGWGTALKPALEPITVARKPLIGTVAENVQEYGTGAINVEGCRVASDEAIPSGGGCPSYRRSDRGGDGKTNDGRNAENWTEYKESGTPTVPSATGRWPANLIHDGSAEVIERFPETASTKRNPETCNKSCGASQVQSDSYAATYGDAGSAARFFYCAKASKKDRDEGLEGFEAKKTNDGRKVDADNAYQRGASFRANSHPTVKPTDLMRYLCRLVTQPGGVVLDPFMGSGSTGKAAMLEELRFIGIEREEEYVNIARARIGAAAPDIFA